MKRVTTRYALWSPEGYYWSGRELAVLAEENRCPPFPYLRLMFRTQAKAYRKTKQLQRDLPGEALYLDKIQQLQDGDQPYGWWFRKAVKFVGPRPKLLSFRKKSRRRHP